MKKSYIPHGCDQQGRYETGVYIEAQSVGRLLWEALVAAVWTVGIIVLVGVLQ